MESPLFQFEARLAARRIFGPQAADEGFMEKLDRETLKKVFKRRALETHPDRAKLLGKSELFLKVQFERLTEAYETLDTALREHELWAEELARIVVAVDENDIRVEAGVTSTELGERTAKKRRFFTFGRLVAGFALALTAAAGGMLETAPANERPKTENAVFMPIRPDAVFVAAAQDLVENSEGDIRFVASEDAVTVLQFRDDLFEAGSSEIPANVAKMVNTLVGRLDRIQIPITVTVIGHVDPTGNEADNRLLSKARAAAGAMLVGNTKFLRTLPFAATASERPARSLSLKIEKTSDWWIGLEKRIVAAGEGQFSVHREHGALVVSLPDNIYRKGQVHSRGAVAETLRRAAGALDGYAVGLEVEMVGFSDRSPIKKLRKTAGISQNGELAVLRAQWAGSLLGALMRAGPTVSAAKYSPPTRTTRSIDLRLSLDEA